MKAGYFNMACLNNSWSASLVLGCLLMAAGCTTTDQRPEGDVAPVVTSVPASASTGVPDQPLETDPAQTSSSTPDPKPSQDLPDAEERLLLATGDDPHAERMRLLLKTEKAPLNVEDSGYYMDVQYANLQQKLNESIASVTRYENKISIHLPEALSFTGKTAQISDSAAAALAVIAKVLNEYDKTLVVVDGSSGQGGDEEYIRQLTEEQTMSISAYLSDNDVMLKRLLVMGLRKSSGEKQLQYDGIELILEPIIKQ